MPSPMTKKARKWKSSTRKTARCYPKGLNRENDGKTRDSHEWHCRAFLAFYAQIFIRSMKRILSISILH
jgi:hypothetical protein